MTRPTRREIEILAGKAEGNRDNAIQELAVYVLAESRYGDPDSSLTDWLAAGEYIGTETIESLVAEWDEREE